MAQHDYNIANQTAPNFRTDLNNVLDAIASTNSGTSAPSTTHANQLWYDTTNNILKMRNEGDTVWINLMTLDQSGNLSYPTNIASQAEAEAGTNTSKMMTPERVSQAISALGSSGWTSAGAQATTSGDTVTFSSLPAGIQQIRVLFQGVSATTSNTSLFIHLGYSGGFEVSGYSSISAYISGVTSATSTTGFIIRTTDSAANAATGIYDLCLIDGTTQWVGSHSMRINISSGSEMAVSGGGSKTLTGELTQLRVQQSGTFDAGKVNILYR